MGQSKNCNDAVPDGKPANADHQRRADGHAASLATPDLGGSFEDIGQVHRPESEQAAKETERNSSAGS